MTNDKGLGAGIHKVNEGLDENRGFMSDNVSTQEVFRFFVDNKFYETVVGIALLKAEGIAFGCRRVMVDGNIHVISRCRLLPGRDRIWPNANPSVRDFQRGCGK